MAMFPPKVNIHPVIMYAIIGIEGWMALEFMDNTLVFGTKVNFLMCP
jgi:hypothetical protein